MSRLRRIAQVSQHICARRHHGPAHDYSGCPELPSGLPPTVAHVAKDCPVRSACLWQSSPWHSTSLIRLLRIAQGVAHSCQGLRSLLTLFVVVVAMALHMIAQVVQGGCPHLSRLPRIARLLRMFLAAVTVELHMIPQVAQNYPWGCPRMPRWPRVAQGLCLPAVAKDCPIARHVPGSRDHGTAHDFSGCQELPMGLPTDAQVAKDCRGCSACLWSSWHCP